MKYLKYIFVLLFIVLLGTISYFNRDKIVDLFSSNIPTVIGGNFDLNYKKLPLSVDHIDFIFSDDLDRTTINKETIKISPQLEGDFSLINSNTIRFLNFKKQEIGKIFDFTFLNKIKSKSGKNIEEINFELEIISDAKVIKITPSGKLDNLSQNFAVFFNVPMVPLTDLDSRDSLPCPIEITPKVEGKCSWTTTSVLEFIPTNRLYGATDYKIKVENKEGLLYPLGESEEIIVQTPRLNLYISDRFNVSNGIRISSNFDIPLKEINSKISVYENKKKLDINIEKENNNFILKLKNGSFNYDTNYLIKTEKEINSTNGNIAYKNLINKSVQSLGFLKRVTINRNIYSNTGTLINTRNFYIGNNDRNKYIGVKDIFINLEFEEEINLSKEYFSFYDKNNNFIDFDLSFIKDEKYNKKTDKYDEFLNKKKVKLSLKKNLLNDNTYNLKVSKNINKYLKGDIIKTYNTSKKLIIKDFKFLNYGKSCLYLSNRINYYNISDELFETFPKSRKVNIDDYEYIPYNKEKLSDKDLELRGYCREAKYGEYLYVLNTRLNSQSEYEIKIGNKFEDIYGNKLKNLLSKKIKTGNILEKDKYLYSSISKNVNVIPNNLPIVINLQTINLNSANLKICEMNELGYFDYVNNHWKKGFTPKCINKKEKEVKLKNKGWNYTFNKIDLEKDILEESFKEKFILVYAAKPGFNFGEDDGVSFKNIYIKSNVSVVFEQANNKKLLFITDFKGNILNDVSFKFYEYDYKNKKVKLVDIKPQLNKKTKVFEFSSKKNFNYIFVKSGENIGLLDLGENYFSNYDFKYISGESSSEKNYLYLYTERPIYKPGDTVFVKGILRKFLPTGYTKTDIKNAELELVGPSGKTISSNKILVGNNSNFDTKFIIPRDVDLGSFRFRFKVENGKNNYTVRNNARFYIEEYRKPTFKVKIENNKKDIIIGNSIKLEIKPEYYFGGKMLNTSGEYSVLSQNYFFDAKDYSDYSFGEGYRYFDCIYWGYCNYNDNLENRDDFKIDSSGKYNFEYDFAKFDNIGEKIVNFSFDVRDPDTSRVVSKTVSTVLHNTDSYVGIKSNYYNSQKIGINLSAVVLDFDANPIKDKKVKIELIKKTWKSVKKKGVDGIFYNDYSLEEKLENTYFMNSNTLGEFNKNIKTKDSGEYEIRAIYTGKNKKSFISSKTVYVAGEEYISWHNDNNDITEFVAEKIQVKVGDKAEYMLKSPINRAKALIIIEKDDAILDYFIHDIKSYSDKIIIPVKSSYYPNYYIRGFLIGEEKNNPLPVYKRALIVTKVNTAYKKLNVKIQSNKQDYLPGDKVNLKIKVTDSNGMGVENADLSISLVDESLLALKGNPKKNPYAFFYDLKRYLGTVTYCSLSNLIEKLEIKGTADGEKGGSGDKVKGGNSKKKRGEFKDTVFWTASKTTDKNGNLTITTDKLPDNLTTWVIEVLANTKNDIKIGVNYETIKTTKKLIINDNLPRFFGSNDKIILSPVVFNKTGKDKEFDISLNITNAEIVGAKTKNILIKSGEQKTINFEIKVKDIGISEDSNTFNSKINLKAISKDKKEIDEIEKFVKITEVSTKEAVSTFGKTKASSFEEKLNLQKIKKQNAKLTINYSATLLSSILDGVDYLNNYPYGCSEQKTSALMPNIFIKQLYTSVGKDFDLKSKKIKYWAGKIDGYREKSVDQVIKEYLVNIRKYQKNDGGFVYFYNVSYGPNYSDFALTSYILESGANIRNIGYKLEESTYFDSIKYLKSRFYKNKIEGCIINKYNDCKYSETDRLKAIGAILDFDSTDYEAYKMWKLLNFENSNNSLNLEKVKVISKLLKLKQITSKEKNVLFVKANAIIDKIISEELVFNPRGAYLGKSTYYSRFRNTTSLLEAVSLVGLENFSDIEKILDNINRWLISQKKNGSFGSTSDNISLIKAITKYLESSNELKDVKNFTKLKLNNNIIEEKKFDDNNKLDVFTKILKIDNLKDNNSFVVEKNGNGTIYYDLNLTYYKEASNIKARDEGFFVETKYYKYDEYKKIDSIKKEEYIKYQNREMSYDDMQYPKDTFEYLLEVKGGNVGDLLIVDNKIITTETRDKVAFEGFIPSGSELINPNLDTSSKKEIANSFYFNKTEYRTDRFFGYKQVVYPGIHNFTYLIRLTHSGEYSIKPSRMSEFYNVEVFGRDSGKIFKIKN